MADRLSTLPEIHAACWQQLALAAEQREHPWRLMALATVAGLPAPANDALDADDGTPATEASPASAELRNVVLREVDAEAQALVFFTDARSPKVAQLQAAPLASLLVWSAALGWQLRLRVRLDVEFDGLMVSSRWARLKMRPAAQDYLSPLPPGTPLGQPVPERSSRGYFAVVSATVLAMDWLELRAEGQRRALFEAGGQTAQWLTP